MTSFPDVLTQHLRREPGRPLVTFYDDDSGERVELSVATYANWVAKVAGLLEEEFDVRRGNPVVLDLPTHWLGPVLLGACWQVGAQVVAAGSVPPVVVVSGPDGLETHATAGVPVLATALRPLGVRFATPLPSGVVDLGVEVWSFPDAFVVSDPPDGADIAAYGLTQGELLAVATSTRRLTTSNPVTPDGVRRWAASFAGGGSTVLVRHPDPQAWAGRLEAERITAADQAPTAD